MICPNPLPWNKVFEQIARYARAHPCTPPYPPTPLILAGWAYSNDVEKMRRWQETVAWASNNGCAGLVEVPGEDFCYVEEPASYTAGPLGGPVSSEVAK
jgi:hypothetical protein